MGRAFRQCREHTQLAVVQVELDTLIKVLSVGSELAMGKLEFIELMGIDVRGKTDALYNLLRDRHDNSTPVCRRSLKQCFGVTATAVIRWTEVVPEVHH